MKIACCKEMLNKIKINTNVKDLSLNILASTSDPKLYYYAFY